MPRCLYLIDRGRDRPEYYHPTVPYHRVIVCDNGKVARWEAGDTLGGATAWQLFARDLDGSGWLLIRLTGLDVDYGSLVRGGPLPGGMHAGFYHYGPQPKLKPPVDPWDLLKGAVWWSTRPLPDRLAEFGVRIVPDELTDPDLSTHRLIERSEAIAADKDHGIRPFGYRYTLALVAANREHLEGADRQRLLEFAESS